MKLLDRFNFLFLVSFSFYSLSIASLFFKDQAPDYLFPIINFFNNQYVLYQLLTKHGHPCDISEFNILKTVERKTYHDEICRELFRELGWNFVSVF